jgi:hypothetical protein
MERLKDFKIEKEKIEGDQTYLVAYKLEKGLLINFGAKSLEIKRLRHPFNKMPNTIPSRQSNNPKI